MRGSVFQLEAHEQVGESVASKDDGVLGKRSGLLSVVLWEDITFLDVCIHEI